MQMYLAAVTAEEGDEEFALRVINTYKLALEDLAAKWAVEKDDDSSDDNSEDKDEKKSWKKKIKVESFLGPFANSLTFEGFKISAIVRALVSKFSIPSVFALPGVIGQVDELDETNNIAEITISINNPGEEEFSPEMLLGGAVFSGVAFTSSEAVGGVVVVTPGLGEIVIIIAAVVVVAYVVNEWASNPIIEKYKKEIDNGDGTITVIEKDVKLNGDIQFIIKIIDKITGKTLLVVHLVYSGGVLVHEDVKHQDPNYFGSVWDLGIDFINLNEWERIR